MNVRSRGEPTPRRTFEEFHYSFTNTMNDEDAQAAFERYAAPGPGRVLFEGAFANFNPHTALQLDFKNEDRRRCCSSLEAQITLCRHRSTRLRQSASSACRARSPTTRSSPGRSHFTIGQEGWEEVADYALDWAVEHARVGAPA